MRRTAAGGGQINAPASSKSVVAQPGPAVSPDAGLQNYDTGDIADGVEDDAERGMARALEFTFPRTYRSRAIGESWWLFCCGRKAYTIKDTKLHEGSFNNMRRIFIIAFLISPMWTQIWGATAFATTYYVSSTTARGVMRIARLLRRRRGRRLGTSTRRH